jgi:AcrR family transcriptional regulator
MHLTEGAKRRRGADLEAALLDAAWEELLELGYARMTFEGVARRAGTSRPVVHRRWRTKPELVLAALGRYYVRHPVVVPDTGSLREDVIAILTEVSAQRTGLVAVLTLRLSGYFEETGTTLADLRARLIEQLVNDLPPEQDERPFLRVILERAAARGEIDLAAITPRVESLPFDLLRNEMLVVNGPASAETIVAIVDEVFLPLATRGAPQSREDGVGD